VTAPRVEKRFFISGPRRAHTFSDRLRSPDDRSRHINIFSEKLVWMTEQRFLSASYCFLFAFSLFLPFSCLSPGLRLSRPEQVVCYGLALRTCLSFANLHRTGDHLNTNISGSIHGTMWSRPTNSQQLLIRPHWRSLIGPDIKKDLNMASQAMTQPLRIDDIRHETSSRPDVGPIYVRAKLFPQ
jgi:hypothetical protein